MFSLPTRKNLVHKAIEPRKLSASIAAIVEARTDDVWEVKYDGCHGILVKANGKAYGFSRQGEPIAGAMDRQLKAMEDIALDNYVIFVEGWNPTSIHSVINGNFRRTHKEGELYSLKAVIFDYVPLDAFMKGKWQMGYDDRAKYVKELVFNFKTFAYGNLFEQAFSAATKAECVAYVAKRQDEHGEVFAIDGFMRKARDGFWTAGAGSDGTVLKDKDLFTVDLKVDGLVEGKGKFVGMLGAYECTYNGKPQLVGGGKLTDKQRKFIWENQSTPEGGIGSIIEVHALGESTNGLLREPRYARTRHDKTEGE